MASPVEESLRLAQGAFAQGRIEETRSRCVELLALEPANPRVLHLAAVVELASGDSMRALGLVDRALAQDPLDARQHHTRGLALRAAHHHEDAVEAFREAVRLSPKLAEAHAGLGRALLGTRESFSAVQALTRAVQLDPRDASAYNDLGVALLEQSRAADAEASFRRAIELAPDRSHPWNNLGNALRTEGRREEALAAFRGATQRKPPLAGAWTNLGNLLREDGDIEDARQCLDRALALDPGSAGAHLSAAIAQLLAGDFDHAWAHYAWRNGKPDESLPASLASLASGARVELTGEQGLGDVLFYLRWARKLRERGLRLAFRGDARVFGLLEPLAWFESLREAADNPLPDALQVAVGDLPWASGAMEPYPSPVALQPAPGDVEAAQALLAAAGPPPYVGLAWRAGMPSKDGAEHLFKEIGLDTLAAALAGVDATLVSLQRESKPGELERLAGRTGRRLLDASSLNGDLAQMLGLLQVLDEYVGVSSTNVHLRAGLGKEARILVPVPAEWRYGRDGDTTPWFPGFRLYRQTPGRGWDDAMASLASDLGRRFGGAR